MVGNTVIVKNMEKKRLEEINCELCRITIIFADFEKDIYENMFNDVFLWNYHSKLIFHLCQIFEIEKAALCCFLDDEFHYRGRDRLTGKTWSISQTEPLKHEMKLKLEELKKFRNKQLDEKKEKNKSFSRNQKGNNFGRKKDKNKIDSILNNMCMF